MPTGETEQRYKKTLRYAGSDRDETGRAIQILQV